MKKHGRFAPPVSCAALWSRSACADDTSSCRTRSRSVCWGGSKRPEFLCLMIRNSPFTRQSGLTRLPPTQGWGMTKAPLQYQGQQAGSIVGVICESDLARACGNGGAVTGLNEVGPLVVRQGMCPECAERPDQALIRPDTSRPGPGADLRVRERVIVFTRSHRAAHLALARHGQVG